MQEENLILEYNEENVVTKQEKTIQMDYYYNKSINALIEYMKSNETNPNEKQWNKYAINEKYLSSKTIGYLSGMGFNTLCRKTRKQLNKEKKI